MVPRATGERAPTPVEGTEEAEPRRERRLGGIQRRGSWTIDWLQGGERKRKLNAEKEDTGRKRKEIRPFS